MLRAFETGGHGNTCPLSTVNRSLDRFVRSAWAIASIEGETIVNPAMSLGASQQIARRPHKSAALACFSVSKDENELIAETCDVHFLVD